ncbi:hypothetical protein F511_06957 [Dorcoceras hygrometricum]|uniref:Uncharacterized protein n=1 Tax=Dorcoceras hygrometricum TaxID=472368 RepID=A0A2Z7D3S6_9LAMI|nr:hypothetical protein F511_06957 [Dorcoceras hygrometricum]
MSHTGNFGKCECGCQSNLDQEMDDFEGHTEAYFTMTSDKENDGVKPIQEVDNLLDDPAAVIIQDLTMNPSERSVQSIVLPSVDGGDFEETIHIEDEFTLSEYGGIQTMKVLDEIVADARMNNCCCANGGREKDVLRISILKVLG